MPEKANILFVDDEERVLRSLKILFKYEYNVQTALNGNEAVDIIKNNRIHVIVSDQRMPIMPGVEVLRQVKEISPNTMRLLLTGYSDLAAIVGSVNEGEIFRYINKPWDKDEIRDTVAKAAQVAISLENVFYKPEIKPTEVGNTSKLGILVIDEEVETCAIVRKLVKDSYPVKCSSDIIEAFSILSEMPIAIVISEIKINKEDITSALKMLKKYHPHILTLVLTSFQDANSLINLINQGQIYRFLPKPIVANLLARAIRDSMWHYTFLRKVPQALERYTIDVPKENPIETKVSSKIMDYLKKIRSKW